MTYSQAEIFIKEELYYLVQRKFLESYPDTFNKVRARSKEEFDASNPCMHSWYMQIINSLTPYNLSPKYNPNPDYGRCDYSQVKNFYDDLQASENWQAFILENLKCSWT